ncbi:MAG: hypothetical protein QOH82_632 [Mycobacterium sp.]|nr:hypothetical protein [Mycobacterium sp.]
MRIQLVHGEILRRRKQKQLAAESFGEALATFERIGTPLWAARARGHLDRMRTAPAGASALTPAERRVAERAVAGMSNREIAAELFISVKTVETNLSNVYRKLGIRSRAQLFSSLAP